MTTSLLDLIPSWAVFLIACLLIGLPLELGRRLRLVHQKRYGDADGDSMGIVVVSLLGLLGFLLAFTFGMAGTRYEERRQAVLAEANVIGTAYLRSDFLSEQQRSEAKRLFRHYVEIRSDVAPSAMTRDALEEVIAQSVTIQSEIWQISVSAARSDPTPVTGLFIQAVNDVIDAHSNRVMIGMRSTIPTEIWIGLYIVAAIALGSAGFQWGSDERQSVYPDVALVLAFAGVLALVADLDDPTRGFITTDQFPMQDLARSLRADAQQS